MRQRLVVAMLAASAALVVAPAVWGGAGGVRSATSVTPPSRPGPWQPLGKVAVSRIGGQLHLQRTATAPGPKALAFVVTSPSKRRIHVSWTSYCEFDSDDGYTEDFSGNLSGIGRITYYPRVFDGATLCYLWINTVAVKGSRVTAAAFWY
jgi:hypothetical protein